MRRLVCLDGQGNSKYWLKRDYSQRIIHALGIVKTTASRGSSMEAGIQLAGLEKKDHVEHCGYMVCFKALHWHRNQASEGSPHSHYPGNRR